MTFSFLESGKLPTSFFVRSLTNIAVHFSDKASNTGNIAKAKE